ncbi:hypothetical protein PIB30_059768 [Stylosanthes scabra]|uniref:Uncharacterized protein n=1 Tax=Stylosanthes scabra TaxID=79078 RepID=A0ABU6QK06_9FABA|nr:hypothetical protein [Stylosanthes scabra]
MSNHASSSAGGGEAAAIAHINNLIQAARGGGDNVLSAADRIRNSQWYVNNSEEVSRLITAADGADHGNVNNTIHLHIYNVMLISFPCFLRPSHGLELRRVLEKPPNNSSATLCRPEPMYHPQTIATRSRGIVHRFIVVVGPRPHGAAFTATGRYSTDIHLARKDAASQIASTLLEVTRKPVDDFNYDKLEQARQRISEIDCELEALQTHHRQMNEKWRSFRQARYLDILDSEWSEESD